MIWLFQLFSCLNVLLPQPSSHCINYCNLDKKIDRNHLIFNNMNLSGVLDYQIFENCLNALKQYEPNKQIIAICDFTKASNTDRFFILDFSKEKMLVSSLVAHGKNSGVLFANIFSNQIESLKSSLGFYRIGPEIISPKHGKALLLDGLQKGINDNARKREIIIHSADYVSHEFIDKNGRLGRSFGCPALPKEVLSEYLSTLANGALLYVYGSNIHP